MYFHLVLKMGHGVPPLFIVSSLWLEYQHFFTGFWFAFISSWGGGGFTSIQEEHFLKPFLGRDDSAINKMQGGHWSDLRSLVK